MRRFRHRRTRQLLDAAADGEIHGRFEDLVRRHLAECPDCTKEIALRRAMKDALGRYGDDAAALGRLQRFAAEGPDTN